MAELTPERVREALRTVLFPNFRRDIVTLGMVGEEIAIDGDTVRLHVRPGTDKPEVLQQLARAIDAALRRLPGVAHVDVHFARAEEGRGRDPDRKSTRLNSSHSQISYAVFCLKKKKEMRPQIV